MDGVWEEMISLHPAGSPRFEVLGPAKEHRERDAHPTDWSGEGEALEQALERDTYPLPLTKDREGYYGPHHFSYWASGHREARLLLECTERLGVDLRAYLDLGCASGRVLRHLALARPDVQVHGCDINRRHVDWVARHLPPSVRVFQNHSIPTLPLADDSLDLVSAFSVLTHIEVFETTWLMELHRVLRPGGVAWVTVHSEDTWRAMEPGWPLYDAMVNFPGFEPYAVPHRVPLPDGRVVFRSSGERSYSSNVFYTWDYIAEVWGRIFDIVERHHRLPDYQDVVVLRKARD